jgi:hypothetical protein
MFVPPQRRKHPIVILLALAIMVFALVYLFMARRHQKAPVLSPVQQMKERLSDGAIPQR